MLNGMEGRKREQIYCKEMASPMQPQSKAELDDRGRAIHCSPKQKNCRSQQAAGDRQQMGYEAVCKQSTEFLITFSRNTLLAKVQYLCHPINSSKYHMIQADLQTNGPMHCIFLQ